MTSSNQGRGVRWSAARGTGAAGGTPATGNWLPPRVSSGSVRSSLIRHGERHAMAGAHRAPGPGPARPPGFLAPYAEIFAIPRAWRFSLAGIIGRMPMAMYGLGTVLLVSAGTGRYGVAGSVSAAASLGGALCAPQLGRLVDRVGQHRVLIPVCLVFALAVAGLIAAVTLHAPDWTLFACGM